VTENTNNRQAPSDTLVLAVLILVFLVTGCVSYFIGYGLGRDRGQLETIQRIAKHQITTADDLMRCRGRENMETP